MIHLLWIVPLVAIVVTLLFSPWARLSDKEWNTTIRRGNEYVSYGLERQRDWWVGVFIVAGIITFFLIAYLSNRS